MFFRAEGAIFSVRLATTFKSWPRVFRDLESWPRYSWPRVVWPRPGSRDPGGENRRNSERERAGTREREARERERERRGEEGGSNWHFLAKFILQLILMFYG